MGGVATGITITANLVGAGLLSLPFAMRRSGLLVGVGAMVLTCALNMGAMLVVARCCELSGAYTYKDIARKALGPRGAVVVSGVMALYTLGSCVSFLVLIGDFLPVLVCDGGCDALLQVAIGVRELLMSVTGAAVLFPLALPRQLSALRYTSTLSAVCIVYTAAMIALRALTAAPDARAPPGDVALFNGLEGLAVSAPILAVAFTAHYNSARFYYELRDRSLRRFGGVLAASFSSVLALYIATAVGGYLLFGSATMGDVLNNFVGACRRAADVQGGGGWWVVGGWWVGGRERGSGECTHALPRIPPRVIYQHWHPAQPRRFPSQTTTRPPMSRASRYPPSSSPATRSLSTLCAVPWRRCSQRRGRRAWRR